MASCVYPGDYPPIFRPASMFMLLLSVCRELITRSVMATFIRYIGILQLFIRTTTTENRTRKLNSSDFFSTVLAQWETIDITGCFMWVSSEQHFGIRKFSRTLFLRQRNKSTSSQAIMSATRSYLSWSMVTDSCEKWSCLPNSSVKLNLRTHKNVLEPIFEEANFWCERRMKERGLRIQTSWLSDECISSCSMAAHLSTSWCHLRWGSARTDHWLHLPAILNSALIKCWL